MEELPKWVGLYVGLPYLKGGRDPLGIDCWGLFVLVQREQFGVALPDYDGPIWDVAKNGAPRGAAQECAEAIGAAAAAFAARFAAVPAGNERCGDGVLLRMRGHPIHIGLIITPGLMLHIEDGCGAVIESYRERAWSSRIVSFHRAGA